MEMIKEVLRTDPKHVLMIAITLANSSFVYYLGFYNIALGILAIHFIADSILLKVTLTNQDRLIKIQEELIDDQATLINRMHSELVNKK